MHKIPFVAAKLAADPIDQVYAAVCYVSCGPLSPLERQTCHAFQRIYLLPTETCCNIMDSPLLH